MPFGASEVASPCFWGGVSFAGGNSFFYSKPTGRFGLSPKPEVPIFFKKC